MTNVTPDHDKAALVCSRKGCGGLVELDYQTAVEAVNADDWETLQTYLDNNHRCLALGTFWIVQCQDCGEQYRAYAQGVTDVHHPPSGFLDQLADRADQEHTTCTKANTN